MKTSITTRITLAVLLAHAVLLPALYLGLGVVARDSHAQLFEQHVRTFAHNIAAEMEIGDVLTSHARIADFLDRAILNAEAVYADYRDADGSVIRSNLSSPGLQWPGRQDFRFAGGGDGIYCIVLPVSRGGRSAELRLGFDERPTESQIGLVMQRTAWVLGAYLCVVVALAVALGFTLSRQVRVLARAARDIASGNSVQSLRLESRLRELHELGADLENMRAELVGVNERLRLEIAERESIELRRIELESRLRHRHRVETVGALAGGMAHEINNALLPVLLLAEVVLGEIAADSPVRGDVEGILKSARHAKEIVAKVLLFTRAQGVEKLELIDLQQVVREASRLFDLLVPPTVSLRVNLAGPYPPVRGDPALALQLVMNLLTNGYQALSGGAGSLVAQLELQAGDTPGIPEAGQEYVVLVVADTGAGMSAETMERIFEPFYTTREVGQGTGLGLAVVHGIAEKFGATIQVESKVGTGTTFRVYFPVAQRQARTASASVST